MNKFNEIARTVLGEAETEPTMEDLYREASQLLSAKGLRAFEQSDILEVIKKAIKLGYDEGRKAAESNPFK